MAASLPHHLPVSFYNCNGDDCSHESTSESEETSDGTKMGISIRDSHRFNMLHQQDNFRDSSICCDVELICEDGISLKAHRVVLAASSPYFKAMFSGGLAEERQSQVPIHGVSSATLKILVDCVYTGQMERLCQDNVEKVAVAANMLQIHTAEALCTKFMSEHLDKSNAIGVHRFATACNYNNLANSASRYIEDNLMAVCTAEEFMDLSPMDLPKYLRSSKINCHREGKLLRAVIAWIEKSIEERRIYVHTLLKLVNFSIMPYMSSISDTICNDAALKRIVKLKFEDAGKNCSGESVAKERSGMTTVIYVVGGWGCVNRREKGGMDFMESATVRFFNVGCGKWHKAEGVRPGVSRHFDGIAAIGSTFYLVGGLSKECEVLDSYEFFNTSDETWFKAEGRLKVGRFVFGLQEFNGCLYAFGGRSDHETILGSIEKLDPKKGEWDVIGHMPKARCWMKVVSYGGLIYVIGGLGDSGLWLNDFMSYNPETNEWNQLAPWLNPRKYIGVAVLDGYLYVVGGSPCVAGENTPSDTVDRYSFEKNEWTMVTPLKQGVRSPGVAAANGCLFVFGGQARHVGIISDSVYYDPKTGEWHSGISMPKPRIWCQPITLQF